MKRIEFLRKAGTGIITSTLLGCQSSKSLNPEIISETEGSTNGSSSENCEVTNTETAGPFPTKSPASYVMEDITSNREGVLMNSYITIKNINDNCTPLVGAIVDIWHCDAGGNYSQYGASSYASENFLRGRQISNADGLVAFKTIFPGWYPGRATHIHVQIFDSSGKSLLVTQIAFPKEVCDNVFTNASSIYTNGTQDTSNTKDGIFRDGYANELAGVSGSIENGYELNHTIVVSA
ncbi:intradiol ring-cleavage dioxygenase [uncultured Arcticibacterium sp.]|uniref:dioxygenase family protein n=1 Tax=uncultured Arcticibacterium sp. TaxID=2173042 RepID=UPI0030FC12CD